MSERAEIPPQLQQELHCWRGALEYLENQLKEKNANEKDLDVSLVKLGKGQRAGLLESLLLFAKADEGMARDSLAEYRQTNRAKLRQYLIECVTAIQLRQPTTKDALQTVK